MKKFVSGLVLFLTLVLCSAVTVQAGEKEKGYYTVLAGCNLRRTPSIEGVIVTVVKEGEVVYFLGSRAGDYSFVRFGDIEGYVFSGVIGDPAGDTENAAKPAEVAEEIVKAGVQVKDAETPADAETVISEEEASEIKLPVRAWRRA